MIKLTLNPVKYENDILELCRMFEQFTDKDVDITMDYDYHNGIEEIRITSSIFGKFIKHYIYPIKAKSEL